MFVYLPSIKKSVVLSPTVNNRSQFLLLFLFITFYSVFEFAGGDFFHYKEFYEVEHIRGQDDGLDPIYLWLIDAIPNNYYLWRSIIWGAASFIWIQLIKYLGYSVRLAGCLFFLVVFFLFVGARQALGFSILYLGVTMILTPKQKGHRVIGMLLFLSSYFFHSTMIVYMILSVICFIPFSKTSLIIAILISPFIYKVFDLFTDFFIFNLSAYNETSAATITRYMESDLRSIYNINGLIRLSIDRLPIFLLLFMALKNVFWKGIKLGGVYNFYLKMTIVLVYISYMFVGREVSAFIAPRFWDAALFPFTLFLGGYFTSKKINKLEYLAICMLILSKLITYFVSFSKI